MSDGRGKASPASGCAKQELALLRLGCVGFSCVPRPTPVCYFNTDCTLQLSPCTVAGIADLRVIYTSVLYAVSEVYLSRYNFKAGGHLISYATPTDPGTCKLFFTLALKSERLSKVSKLIFKVMGSRWLDWYSHLTRNNVISLALLY